MREVAKSMLGFSWAVSMFGLQQAARLLGGAAQTAERTAEEIDEVSRVIGSHLSGTRASQFRTGDEWQRRMVDAVFEAGTRATDPRQIASVLDPRTLVQAANPRLIIEKSVDVFQRSVEGVMQSVDSLTRSMNAPADAAPSASATTTDF